MTLDEREFFREATLRICGNLEIERALLSSLNFLRQEMPVDRILLQLYEEGLNVMQTVAMATPTEAKTVGMLTPMTSEARQGIMRFEKEYDHQGSDITWLFQEDPHRYKWIDEMFHIHGIKATSLLVLPLKIEHRVVGGGGLLMVTEGDRKFTQQHANLLSLLREPFAIAMSHALRHREVLRFKEILADDNRYLKGELKRLTGDSIIGANFGLKEVMEKASHVASLDSPVLLLGETGVGKDVIANAIHYSSTRRDGPFINVNCGAIPDTLIDSELFGHEKGAFTGALSQKRGRFERADKGTILLDEIGELPPQAQVRLLRVLQEKEIERLGGTKTIPLDIRIIAATNRNLEEMVKTGQFREDLWFRINVFPIWIPPLRERKSDIPALLQHFISLKTKELKLPAIPTLSPGVIDMLMEYDWPGNVRELQNVVERALILNPSGPLTFKHINLPQHRKSSKLPEKTSDSDYLDDAIVQHIKRALDKTKGKIHGKGGAAEILGINPSTLRNRMNKLGIKYGRKA
ncbi:MAG: sigma 54-interacting transcriptional regulator [Desulfobacteraceae bacterium]|nr:MAG: sigma 54-interacting transcriptional regulator [Desulfobacteraceae bacterium]